MNKQLRMALRRDAELRNLPKPQVKVLGAEYAMSFVCFTCKTSNMRHFDESPCDYPDTMECPVCKDLTFNLGRYFKPPKKSDSAQWNKVKFLVEHGFLFQKIRIDSNTHESVPYPKTLADAKEFVVKYKKWARGITL